MKITSVSRLTGLTALLAASALALSACGGGDATAKGSEGSLASTVDLKGVDITIGSKEYPEQKILGEILIQTLEASGATVKDKTGLAGTNVARAALESGQIDAYYEYTGTAWLTVFKKTDAIGDPNELFDAVETEDAGNGISWFARAPFNNTYGVGASPNAADTGVTSMSEYAELTRTNPDQATLCASAEFKTRDDGLPGLEKHYGFTQPKGTVYPVEQTVIYQAVKQKKCNFMYLVSTDARLAKNKITVLDDDKTFFPIYNPAVNMRTDVYDANAAKYDKLFDAVAALLTQDEILELNGKVELDGLPAGPVVTKFLKAKKII
ncbi:glycine/betaine ABC transporter substrate-binding protein [Aeromicrobium sp. A1-2]|uniref:glycine betaine ABC transporter substrate-binding protein n=1 Tax=Aeromicrobium sp. A1-2 TaxID=2107713 RepID=UPI000E46AA0A|nr:glycine betaine ABC transporter substrate-binding protein [Aeromicrobium sp. A1-2]AXT84155.1 glycine/betaine ABC transporter substrate-binding protein [Aeromicrobium sp. A1-2]